LGGWRNPYLYNPYLARTKKGEEKQEDWLHKTLIFASLFYWLIWYFILNF
jgi:hypothetical protein